MIWPGPIKDLLLISFCFVFGCFVLIRTNIELSRKIVYNFSFVVRFIAQNITAELYEITCTVLAHK